MSLMRCSHRPRPRWRRSSTCGWPDESVMKAVTRRPSMSVMRSWHPAEGYSTRTITRVPGGKASRRMPYSPVFPDSSSPVISVT